MYYEKSERIRTLLSMNQEELPDEDLDRIDEILGFALGEKVLSAVKVVVICGLGISLINILLHSGFKFFAVYIAANFGTEFLSTVMELIK